MVNGPSVVRYGPEVPGDDELRLLGNLDGKRVLELGSGSRSSAVALAARGAHVIAVDPHPDRMAVSQVAAEDAEVRVEWQEGALTDLAFLRGDSVDLAFSVGAVVEVEDMGRLFRQVHRVLRPGSAFVFAYEHPALVSGRHRSYFDESPATVDVDGVTVTQYPRTISAVFTALHRSGLRVDAILEPQPVDSLATLPTTIIWRARKEGV
ncbi:MAG TPA: class I SAM-dependent methyltransferase [Acidimicrobiia bacterium]|nr:class I SAM-dependent methyltransferase [Acidimicrobiia bacterium]